jgi:hypothetical protein
MRNHALTLIVLLLSGCARTPRPVATALPPTLVLGDFVDDYGARFTVTGTEWFQHPRSGFQIVAWHVDSQYLIAQNATTNASAPGKWTRIDWMQLEGQGEYLWGFCFSAFDAPTREVATSIHVVDRRNPKKGCNGYPFSRMKRSKGP